MPPPFSLHQPPQPLPPSVLLCPRLRAGACRTGSTSDDWYRPLSSPLRSCFTLHSPPLFLLINHFVNLSLFALGKGWLLVGWLAGIFP